MVRINCSEVLTDDGTTVAFIIRKVQIRLIVEIDRSPRKDRSVFENVFGIMCDVTLETLTTSMLRRK